MPQRLTPQPGSGKMRVTLKSYLERLRELEGARPEGQRRSVPSIRELAREIEVNPATLSNVVNNHTELLNLEMGSRIIRALRRRGFDTGVSDILAFIEGE